MKKAFIFCILFFVVGGLCFSQNNPITLDEALSKSIEYLKTRIPVGSKIVVLNFTSNSPALSDYIIEELTAYIVNDNHLTVVDRQNLEIIRQEMEYQLSGEVNDETAQSIGKKLGAQTIISGSITAIGATYRMRIRAIAVETAAIQGMHNVTVAQDSTIAALTRTAYIPPVASNNQHSEQGNIYGTWYSSQDSTIYIISDNNIIWTSDSNRSVIKINSFQYIANVNQTTKDKYPNGYRVIGIYTETNESNRYVGGTYDRTWYIHTDNRSMIRADLDGYVWNKR
jgi:TolB-like protein